ncbi:exodeoxyribonuclease V subunit alpha [Hydrocarboniphaga sp.]|uniref:exodeoxyribonuclease V subunit alpha n=1 Tax=Hydrocarboniphaga sp. TaxID=2033016 RepID=UPI002604D5D0|nr:exodeoxyribonuclease V subunit alpha [Hydrocarboniphaga sp.]
MADLRLPLAAAGIDEPDAAFASLFAAALGDLHREQGGDAADTAAVIAAANLASMAVQQGHACADLAIDESLDVDIDIDALRRSPMVGNGTAPTPLVLAGTRLYLYRYWRYERQLAARLIELNRPVQDLDIEAAAAIITQLFPASGDAQPDWQKIAAATAMSRHLCIVSGGPGTGKTTTVVRILAALLRLQPNLRIAIAAPTGKAAARLKSSITSQLDALDLPDALRAQLPAEAHTLHRLLGYRPNRAGFRHDASQPLPYQLVVVDEASMLDLALAAKLVAALPADARLILLGDKDQLASVEAGAVYAELSSRSLLDAAGRATLQRIAGDLPAVPIDASGYAMANAVVWLNRAWRFADDGGISRLATAINAGQPQAVREVLAAGSASLAWRSALPSPPLLAATLAQGYEPFIHAVRSAASPAEVLSSFERYRVLCSTRAGAYGSESLNRHLTAQLQRRLGGMAGGARWYAGRAVMVAGNDYALRLFNGDIGVALPDTEGRLLVYFAGDDGLRAFAPGRLANVATAFALTVHKAQGSEFARIDLVIEPTLARGLTRELLYTAVTRAREHIGLWCGEELFDTMVATRLRRRSSIIGAT